MSEPEFLKDGQLCGFELDQHDYRLFTDRDDGLNFTLPLRQWMSLHVGDETRSPEDLVAAGTGWCLEWIGTTGIVVPYLYFRSRLTAAHFKLVWL